MRPSPLVFALFLAACPGGDDSHTGRTSGEVLVDCHQGVAYGGSIYTIGASSPQVVAVEARVSDDATRSFAGLDFVSTGDGVRPEPLRLPDGTLHFVGTRRDRFVLRGETAWFVDTDDVLHRSDAGGDWVPLPPALPVSPRSAWDNDLGLNAFGERLVLWQEGVEDSVFLSADGGRSWRNLAMPVQPNLNIDVVEAFVGSGERVFVHSYNLNGHQLWLSTDDGVSFEEVAPEGILATFDQGATTTEVADDGSLWMLAAQRDGDGRRWVLHHSEDWQHWTTQVVRAPALQDLGPDWPLTDVGAPFEPIAPLQAQPGNRLAWWASIGTGESAGPWYEREYPFASTLLCVVGPDTSGQVTPEFPVSPPTSIAPGELHPWRRYHSSAPAVAGVGQAWFADFVTQNGVWTDGGNLYAFGGRGEAAGILREAGAPHAFVLFHPPYADLGVWANSYVVPTIAKVDLSTGEELGLQEVGPFQDQVTGDRWVLPVLELLPSGGESWPFVHTTDGTGVFSGGLFRPGSPLNQPALPLDPGPPYTFDPDTGYLWFYRNNWLHRVASIANTTSSCDGTQETQDCLRAPPAMNRLWAVDGWLYANSWDGTQTLVRRPTSGASDWETVLTGTDGFADLHVEVRPDGLHELWWVSGDGVLYGAVPDGSGPLRQHW